MSLLLQSVPLFNNPIMKKACQKQFSYKVEHKINEWECFWYFTEQFGQTLQSS